MIPLYLLLENFMSHTRSEIDFSQFDMALIMGLSDDDDADVSNGSGKTTIFESIRWAIYGKCRFRTKKRVIKHGKIVCSVTFVFQLGNDIYKIMRKMSQRSATNEVSLFIQEGNSWRDLSCDTPSATSGKIEELIGFGHETFESSIYFKQNEILQFASSTASQKKDTLKESLHIEIWDKYQDKAKDIVRRLSGKLSILDERIKSFGDLDRDLVLNKVSIDDLDIKIQNIKNDINNNTNKLETIQLDLAKTASVEVETDRQAAIHARGEVIKDRRKHVITEFNKYKEAIKKAEDDCSSMEKQLLEAAHRILIVSMHPSRKKAEEVFKQLSHKLPSLALFPDKLTNDKIELNKHKHISDDAALQLRQLLALEPGKECPTCLSTLEDLDKVSQRRKKRMKFLENIKRESDVLSAELSRSVAHQEDILSKADSSASIIGHLYNTLYRTKSQANNLLVLQEELKGELQKLADEWQSLKTEKENLLTKNSSIEDKRKEVVLLNTELENLRQELVKMSVEYGNLQGHREELERHISERQTLLDCKPALVKELDIHNQLVKAFGKAGVPAIIMENVTEDLRNYANDMLKRISDKPMSIDFVTQKRTDSGSWSETFEIMVNLDDEVNEFDDLSGGEQVRVAIAVRLALSNILMRRMGSSVKFLLLDEIDQALDKRGIQALADALRILSKEFKILAITHNDNMKERFDHIITVQKGPTGSVLHQ